VNYETTLPTTIDSVNCVWQHAHVAELRRSLDLFDATMINVGVMVGSAVFLTAGDVARALPHPMLQLAAWCVAALFSLAGALTIAELGAAMPRAGGLYVYLREAFGPALGFFYGWALFVVIQTAAIAAVAVAFAQYAGHFVPHSTRGDELVASFAIAALTGLNVLGVREGVVTQNFVTVAKLAVMVGLVVLAFGANRGALSNLVSMPHGASPGGVMAFGAALIGPLFAFDGWITTSYVGGELQRPERNVPRTALASVALVAVLYLAVNAAYLFVLGSERVGAGSLVATDTALALIGSRGADVVAALVVVSLFGALNGNILAGARVYYAMAEEGLFFRAAARVHPRLGTPAVALVAQAAVSVALVYTGRFEQLLTCCLFASWLFYALGGVAVFALRRRPDVVRPYEAWGHPYVPGAFVAFAVLLLASTIVAAPRDAAMGTALLATGVPAYFFFRRSAKAPRVPRLES
jgi:APA family basic amino acid/polyamine antiporter